MKETGHAIHPRLGIPLYSLYSETRKPTPLMLEGLDTILVDIQDVGTRVYTYATTVLHVMEACSEAGKAVVILDRPNPINGVSLEGNLLRPAYSSFVGPFPLPMRHGLTLGELMKLYNEVYSIGCRLSVIPIHGWDRNAFFEDTGLPWVPPSPNMPLPETALVYPGQVMLEGTNISEGRGATRPFEVFGAPFVDPDRFLDSLDKAAVNGAILRQTMFRPAFNKWAGQVCRGFQIHVTDRNVFRPYRFTLAALAAFLKLWPDNFVWTDPPYEYVSDKLPIDVIIGDPSVRRGLEEGRPVLELESQWEDELNQFKKLRSDFLLY